MPPNVPEGTQKRLSAAKYRALEELLRCLETRPVRARIVTGVLYGSVLRGAAVSHRCAAARQGDIQYVAG